ncbi:MAG: CPBP family intramembrane metalloprotease [Rhodobacteraceae bacterium]|nr:CPBP family intramembrane metalloprotease [Paracoccaceae bacterium]MCY4141035.1 CPBP family intramembrane metalloprotease [Paracoccaceae bacterium]
MPFRIPLPGLSPAFLGFVGPARQSPEVWRLFVGVILGASCFAATLIGTLHLVLAATGNPSAFDTLEAFQVPSLTNPIWVLWLLLGFGGLSLGMATAARILHGRSPRTLICAPGRPVVQQFCVGVLAAIAALVPGALVVLLWFEPSRNMQVSIWALWMIPALPLVLLQAFSEELLFRGYLQQQLAARFSSRWMWWFLPSFVFGALHFDPETFGRNAPLAALATMVFGLIAGDVTARSGSIGIAVGLHFANNIFALCLFGLDNHLSGLSLYVLPDPARQAAEFGLLSIVDFVGICFAYVVFLAVVAITARSPGSGGRNGPRLPS